MEENTIKIYSVIALRAGNTSAERHELIIDKAEENRYLNCKFFKASLETFHYFRIFYNPSPAWGLGYILGMLTGEYVKSTNISETIKKFDIVQTAYPSAAKSTDFQIQEIINNNSASFTLDEILYFEPFIQEIRRGQQNNEISIKFGTLSSIERLLDWAETKPLFSKSVLNIVREKIIFFRSQSVFFDGMFLNKNNIDLVKNVLLAIDPPIYYEDLKALLFPQQDLLGKLITAYEKQELTNIWSVDFKENSHYFSPRLLIKWLMQHKYLPKWLEKELLDLKIESIKESYVDCTEKFFSLKILCDQYGYDRDEILQEVLAGNIPMRLRASEEIKWATNLVQNRKCVESQPLNGLVQLEIRKGDNILFESQGGITVDMLLYHQPPKRWGETTQKFDHIIYLLPTAEMIEHGLQPYITIPASKIFSRIADENLLILESDVNILHAKQKKLVPTVEIMQNELLPKTTLKPAIEEVDYSKALMTLKNVILQLEDNLSSRNSMKTISTATQAVLTYLSSVIKNFSPTSIGLKPKAFACYLQDISPIIFHKTKDTENVTLVDYLYGRGGIKKYGMPKCNFIDLNEHRVIEALDQAKDITKIENCLLSP